MPLMVQPDLLVQILVPEHEPTKPGLTAGTQSSGPSARSTYPHSCAQRKPWVAHQCPPGRLWVFHQTSREARQCRAASFLARSSNVYSTRQRSYRAESSHEKLMPYSSSLGRTVGLVGRRLQRLGLGFFFFPLPPNPQSNLPQRGTVSERHLNPSTYLHRLFLTTSLYYLPVLRAVSQAKKTKLDKIAVWQAGTYKHGVPLSVTRFVLAPQRAL